MEFEQKIVDGHNIESLPKWAQCHIYGLELKARVAWDRNETVQKLNAIMCEPKRDWFTLPFNYDGNKPIHLWLLNFDQLMSVCSLGKGDLLFIGRAIK
jgi:hypothetical protein